MNFITHSIPHCFWIYKLTGNLELAIGLGLIYGSWVDASMYFVQWKKLFNKEKLEYNGIYNLLHKPLLYIKDYKVAKQFYYTIGVMSGGHPQIDHVWHDPITGKHKKGYWIYEVLIALFFIGLFIIWR